MASKVSTYRCPVRTNNIVESFHNIVAQKSGTKNINIWTFLDKLTHVIIDQKLDLHRLNNGVRPRRPRKRTTIEFDRKIINAQEDLANNRLSLREFLLMFSKNTISQIEHMALIEERLSRRGYTQTLRNVNTQQIQIVSESSADTNEENASNTQNNDTTPETDQSENNRTTIQDIETHEENIHEILEDETDGEDIHEISEDETNEKDIHEISEDETNEENIHEISEDETIEEDIHEISENETDEEDIHEISENETNEEQVEEITEDVIYDEDIYLIPEDDYSYLDDTPETENLPFHPVDWNATNIQMKSSNLRFIKKSRARRNQKIRELRELVRSFFVQFLFAAAPKVDIDDPPKRRSEQPWSPLPSAPPNSPFNGEDSETEENSLPQTPPRRSRTPTSSEPDCSSPIPSPILYPGEPEEVGFLAEDETVSWQEPDSPEHFPSPAPSVKFLGEQEEPRAVADPLLELFRRTCTPWTDPVPERAFTKDPDYFDPEEIRREASGASPDQNILIYYSGVEHPFLAPIRLIDRVFPRSTAQISEIIEIDLE
ncbi:cyclic nucleotide-gated channel beta-1-like [Cardiocondyla obscurior]|uniref:cyclic nucleotide-gated channel beta-1-like n=1 Tax=Cardiocondyla obscurior TaxID=286306 RepID=UPI00396582D8